VLTGAIAGRVDLGTGQMISAGGADILVASYNPAGKVRWAKSFGGISRDQGWDVAVGSAGSILVIGRFGATVDFGTATVTGKGIGDFFLLKMKP